MEKRNLNSDEVLAKAVEQFPFLKGRIWDRAKHNGRDVIAIFSYCEPSRSMAQSVHMFDKDGNFVGEGWL